MKRKEAIIILESFIPSLKRDYFWWGEKIVDKNEDKSWLYRDELYERPNAKWNDANRVEILPQQIPEHFLEDVIAEIDGEKFAVRRAYPERDYRRVYLSVTDFAYYGNTHKYGKLLIDGVSWYSLNRYNVSSNKLSSIEPRVQGIWEVELFRIVGEGEMSEAECPVGESTARFVCLGELMATAAYVTLNRIQGPCILDNASSYATVRTKKDILLTVDSNDNVEWGNKLEKILGTMSKQ